MLSKICSQSSSFLLSQILFTTLVIKNNVWLLFIATTFKQYSNFKLMLINWMLKKNISYNQVEDKTFWEFIADCYMGAIKAKSILSCLGNAIQN